MPKDGITGKGKGRKITQVQTAKRSVSVHKLTGCKDCAPGCCLQARKEMGKSQVQTTKISVSGLKVKLTGFKECATGCYLQAKKKR